MSSPDETVSALMPVHQGACCEHLHEAIRSVLAQTRSVDEFVVIEDGPLTPDQRQVLADLERLHPRVVRVRLAHNRGAGVANQAGLEAASCEWIMKVDADDVSLSHRLATQLRAARPDLDVCGAAMFEFADDPENLVSKRSMPACHEGILSRARWNNPINHPTALYRREAALASGGYPEWRYMQDYGLFARMLARGCSMTNVPDALVLFRAAPDVATRRGSAAARRAELALQRELVALGLIGRPQAVFNLLWRLGYRVMPARAIRAVNRRLLARPLGTSDAAAGPR